MPKIDLGSRSKVYLAHEDVRTPYYGSTVTSVEPRVLALTAKLLPNGEVVVFGEYEVYLLFTYNDGDKHISCFLETVRKEFCEVLDGGAVELKGFAQQNVGIDLTFRPQAECALMKKSGYLWRVEITGNICATLKGETVEKEQDVYVSAVTPVSEGLETATPIDAEAEIEVDDDVIVKEIGEETAPEMDEIMAGGSEEQPEEQPSETPGEAEKEVRVITADGDVKCWRIDDALERPLDSLFELEDCELDNLSNPGKPEETE